MLHIEWLPAIENLVETDLCNKLQAHKMDGHDAGDLEADFDHIHSVETSALLNKYSSSRNQVEYDATCCGITNITFPSTITFRNFVSFLYGLMGVLAIIAGSSLSEKHCIEELSGWMEVMGAVCVFGTIIEYIDQVFCKGPETVFMMEYVPMAYSLAKVAVRFIQLAFWIDGLYLYFKSARNDCDETLIGVSSAILSSWILFVFTLLMISIPDKEIISQWFTFTASE